LTSSEAEYVAKYEAVVAITQLRSLLRELGLPVFDPTTMKTDSSACVSFAKSWDHHHRTKHVDIKYHYVREAHDNGIIQMQLIPHIEQVADMLTKFSTRPELPRFRHSVMPG
jgi:hypothetical protein